MFAATSKEAVEEARKLKDMPEGLFALKVEENPFAMQLHHVQETRQVVYLLQLDALLRENDEGDREGAAESCQAILNTARSLKAEPFLIGLLVRIAEQAIAIASIERLLGQGQVSERNLPKLQELLQAEADDDGLHKAMRGERASGQQTYVRLRQGKTSFTELFGMTNLNVGVSERLLDAFPGIILNGYPEYLQLMNEQVRACKLKDVERAEALGKLEKKVRETRGSVLIQLIMPAPAKVAQASQRSQAWLRCAFVAVAAERFRLNHDAWPRGIDDLVRDGLLKGIPKDPYDGKPLRWKRTPTGVLVYSVGPDKIDDGGKLNRNNPLAAGTDLGVELWNPQLRGVAPPAEEEAK